MFLSFAGWGLPAADPDCPAAAVPQAENESDPAEADSETKRINKNPPAGRGASGRRIIYSIGIIWFDTERVIDRDFHDFARFP